MAREVVSRSLDESLALGRKLGVLLRAGDFIALEGELGAGKSRLAEGIARGLDIEERIPSPTFTLVNEHQGRHLMVHADFYRLVSPDELDELGWRDYAQRDAVIVVEWLSRLGVGAPSDYLTIEIGVTGSEERVFQMRASGPRSEQLLLGLAG